MEWSSAQEGLRQLVDINENKPGQAVKARDEAVEREKAGSEKTSDCREKTELQTEEQSGQFIQSSVSMSMFNFKLQTEIDQPTHNGNYLEDQLGFEGEIQNNPTLK